MFFRTRRRRHTSLQGDWSSDVCSPDLVARLAAEGLTNQEIARELFLSPKTVDKHVSAAMRKVGARSRTELARHLLPEIGRASGRERAWREVGRRGRRGEGERGGR